MTVHTGSRRLQENDITYFGCFLRWASRSASARPAQEHKKAKEGVLETLRSVQGTVFDKDDKPVVGAVVQLKDVRTMQMRSYISKTDGEYHFSSLKIDDDA